MNKEGNKRALRLNLLGRKGQVTIFIIIALVIVSIIALFFILRSGIVPDIGGKTEKSPNTFLSSCLEDKVKEGVNLILIQGGYIENPLNIYFKFEEEASPVKISYLCYNQNDFTSCVNQEPMLIRHLEEEIHNYISSDVESCFNKFASSLEEQGYVIDPSYRKFAVELTEGKINIGIDAEITSTKSGETSKQEEFKVIVLSKLYDLAIVALEIVNKEAMTGEFNPADMFNYPDVDINKHLTRDSSMIYRVQHRQSKEEFRFAVRGQVIP